jgi:hypothetical protein
MLCAVLKGHGNEADFLGFLQKLVPLRSLTLPFEPFRFWLRIRGYIRNRKTTLRLGESLPCPFNMSMSSVLKNLQRDDEPLSTINIYRTVHCKKRLTVFPSPAGMLHTKLSLARNNLIIPSQGEFGKFHPGWGRENCKRFLYSVLYLYLSSLCMYVLYTRVACQLFIDNKICLNSI